MENSDKVSELLKAANTLPQCPGVYKMYDKNGKIIYVGKSKSLKNRVSQYFQNISQHNLKTQKMISCVERFDCVFTNTETEALVLENELIKLHSPKFNIKLKDDKSYPYICLSLSSNYPSLSLVRSKSAQSHKKDKLFGPYSSSVQVRKIIDTVNKYFKLPTCSMKFPRDIGKQRPCLYYHIKQCCGVCTGNVSVDDYREIISQVELFLRDDYEKALNSAKKLMIEASDALNFEKAAMYRDIYNSVQILRSKQKMLLRENCDRDIFGMWSDEISGCISVLVLRNGKLIDSERIMINSEEILDSHTFATFIAEYYKKREYIPQHIMIPRDLYSEEVETCVEYFEKIHGKTVKIHCPERGKFKELLTLSCDNAKEYVIHQRNVSEKQDKKLIDLASLLSLEVVPEEIEAYDISNSADQFVTAGLIRISNGKFNKKGYKIFNIRESSMDDYAAMREAIFRRIKHYIEENDSDTSEKKWSLPDLIFLDGGINHVKVIKKLLDEFGIHLPVFGMIKDNHHKTRTLTDGENEISIAKNQTVFRFIYEIQEEVHRFTFKSMDSKRRKSLKHSSLENIKGIGKSKAKILISEFKNISNIKKATVEELSAVKGISKSDAFRITEYFSSK